MPSVLKLLTFCNFSQERHVLHTSTYISDVHFNAIGPSYMRVMFIWSVFGDGKLNVTDVLHKIHKIDMRTEVTSTYKFKKST